MSVPNPLCTPATQPAGNRLGVEAATGPVCLANTNINPSTGLATDYLNHFNEAIMLLKMLSSCPECFEDFLGWQPTSYREHFSGSSFKHRDLAIAAYDTADETVRERFDSLTDTMTAVLEATRGAMCSGLPPGGGRKCSPTARSPGSSRSSPAPAPLSTAKPPATPLIPRCRRPWSMG